MHGDDGEDWVGTKCMCMWWADIVFVKLGGDQMCLDSKYYLLALVLLNNTHVLSNKLIC